MMVAQPGSGLVIDFRTLGDELDGLCRICCFCCICCFCSPVDSDVDPPQPTMDNAIAAAIIAANAFLFIFVPPVFLFGDFAGFASFPADEFIIITRVLKK